MQIKNQYTYFWDKPRTTWWLSVDSLFPKRDLNLGPKEYVTQGQNSATTLDCSSLLKSVYKWPFFLVHVTLKQTMMVQRGVEEWLYSFFNLGAG